MPVLPWLVKTKGPRAERLKETLAAGERVWLLLLDKEDLSWSSVDDKRVRLVLLDEEDDGLFVIEDDGLSWRCCCGRARVGKSNISITDSLSEEDGKSASAMTSRLLIELVKCK